MDNLKFNRTKDLTGKVFGLCTIIERAENNSRNDAMWIYQCKCGKVSKTKTANLKKLYSCGCKRVKPHDKRDHSYKGLKPIEGYLYIVRIVLSKLYVTKSHYLYDDCYQAGCVGLLGVYNRYDSRKGAKFETWAYPRVWGSIIDEMRRTKIVGNKKLPAIQIVRGDDDLLEKSCGDDHINNIFLQQLTEKDIITEEESIVLSYYAMGIPLKDIPKLIGKSYGESRMSQKISAIRDKVRKHL